MTSSQVTLPDHPFKRQWAWWEHRTKGATDVKWMDQFYKVAQVDTVEKFWILWGHYPLPSVLFAGTAPSDPPPFIIREGRSSRVLGVCLFKEGVLPETRAKRLDGTPWTGLRSLLDLDTHFDEMKTWDEVWEVCCLALLGEATLDGDMVSGIWLANRTRRGFSAGVMRLRLEIWWSHGLTEGDVLTSIEKLTHVVQSHTGKDLKDGWRIK